MLRGADMTICDVYIQTEAGFDVLSRLGEMECVQFTDMNWDVSPIDKRYVPDLCRCADMERNLNYMREEIIKEGIQIPRLRDLSHIRPLHPTEMFEFENMIDSWTRDVKDMSANHTNLKKLKSETKEIHYVLHHLDPILGDVEMGNTKLPRKMIQTESIDRRQLKIITGVVERSTSYHFQTMLWRISHGNIYYREASHDDCFQNPISGREVRKVAFVIICHGDELHQRILKICNGFNVNLYRWPETHDDRLATLGELSNRMQEMDKVLKRTKYQRAATFRNLAVEWETWMTQVMKAKAVYYQLNLFNMDISSNTLIGQCWLPEQRYDEVEAALESTSEVKELQFIAQRTTRPSSSKSSREENDAGSLSILRHLDFFINTTTTAQEMAGARSFMVKTITDDVPPTYYRTNKFTVVFQTLISSYQVGRYKELNPGIFAVVTFPFLFGVMFGDVGHGLLLFLYAFWMINNENKYMYRTSTNEVWDLIFKGRYMILLMGLFAMYMGFLYNEWFSLTCKMMSPYWLNTMNTTTIEDNLDETFELQPKKGTVGYNYKYGIDPGIKLSHTGFPTEISVKMKLAFIIGVAHLVFGLLLSLWNYIYFRKYYAIFLHFLPKLLFILCIYGFLCFLIFHKWLYPLTYQEFKRNPTYAFLATYDWREHIPNLRDEFLHFILWSARREDSQMAKFVHQAIKVKPEQLKCCDMTLVKTILYHIALACFPVLLLGSPIYLYIKNRIQTSRIEREQSYKPQMRGQESDELKKIKEFNVGGVLLHRLWRTMEFGFATVSHMASYLRLWALSMAHTLLSDFLWQEVMRKIALRDFTGQGIWKLYLVFYIWALITLFFLVIMDSLAVFIHVLRLHWIEFMSKFFKGDGVPFRPFALSTVLDEPDVKREEETAAIYRLRQARESAGVY